MAPFRKPKKDAEGQGDEQQEKKAKKEKKREEKERKAKEKKEKKEIETEEGEENFQEERQSPPKKHSPSFKERGSIFIRSAKEIFDTLTPITTALESPDDEYKYKAPPRFTQKSNAKDAQKYDFRANRTNLVKTNTLWETTVHLLMCGLSGGIVAVHEAYKNCGVWSGLGVNLIMALIIPYCVCILVWSAQKLYGRVNQPQLTYPDVAEAALVISPWRIMRKISRPFRYIVEGILVFYGFGACAVFQLMISRNLKQLVDGESLSLSSGHPSLDSYTLVLMLPCALVCMVTDLKHLAPFALIANCYTCGLAITQVWYIFKNPTDVVLKLPAYKSTKGLFQFVGVCLFTLGSTHVALHIESHMNEPKKFHYVLLATVPPITIAMTLIGVVGYWNYGERAVAPLTVHFPFRPFPVRIKMFLCLMLYVIYAVTFYLAFEVEWFYLKRNHQVSNRWFWERLYRILHIIAITFTAYVLPDVTRIMGVIGSISSPLVFVFPPFIELLLDWHYPGLGFFKWRLLKCIPLIIFGLVIFFAGTYINIYDVVTSDVLDLDFDYRRSLLFSNTSQIVDEDID